MLVTVSLHSQTGKQCGGCVAEPAVIQVHVQFPHRPVLASQFNAQRDDFIGDVNFNNAQSQMEGLQFV
jgi:hypothetical protein